MKKRAVTLVEIMVAFFILGLISTTLYYVLKNASHKRAIVTCRQSAKRETTKILKLLESDLRQARLGSFKKIDENTIQIKVKKANSKKDTKLEYVYDKPFLKRNFDGKQWIVSDNLTKFDISPVPDSPGQLVAEIETSYASGGLREDEAQKNIQSQMIVMREDSAKQNDPYWRDVGNVSHFFKTQGSLLAGVKADAKQLVQDFTSEFENLAKDLDNMTAGQIRKAKEKLKASLGNINTKISEMDVKIDGLDSEAVFDMGKSGLSRLWGGVSGRTKRLKKKAGQIKTALKNMKTKGELNWGKISSIAGGDRDRLRKSVKEMYNAKSDIFEAGKSVVENMKKLGMDTSDINMTKWGL